MEDPEQVDRHAMGPRPIVRADVTATKQPTLEGPIGPDRIAFMHGIGQPPFPTVTKKSQARGPSRFGTNDLPPDRRPARRK